MLNRTNKQCLLFLIITRQLTKAISTINNTNPFSSLRCWYNSALLLTEFKRPANSWCFLELAVLILLLHKDNKDTGPGVVFERREKGRIIYYLNFTNFKILPLILLFYTIKAISSPPYSKVYVFRGPQDHLLVWWFAGRTQMTKQSYSH